jgi:hypothetical protein
VWKPRIVGRGEAATQLSGAVLFGILWAELVDMVGTAATAVLLRRAQRRALLRSRDLQELTIGRFDEEFRYEVPSSFNLAAGPPPALRHLADELRPLLEELTGEVALRRLRAVPELQGWIAAAPLAS